jgi:hypothetical protein
MARHVNGGMMRTYFIGDVHGCVSELDALVDLLAPTSGDRLVFLGDYVDRGPDSLGAVRRVKALVDRYPGSAAIAGNHEESLLRKHWKGKDLPEWAAAATDADWAFLDSLPLIHRVVDLDVVAVHGGFFPNYFVKHGPYIDEAVDWRTQKSKRADRARRFLRVRTVSPEGQMVSLGSETAADRHWSEVYDGCVGYAFYGHDPRLVPPEPRRAPFALGMDTGCCFGGRLSAAVVCEGETPAQAEVRSVPAERQYAEPRRSMEE